MNDPKYVIEPSGRKLIDWQELWQFRELFYFFTWRDVKIKYKQTVLGFLWAILQPLFMMLVFTFFFGRTLKIDSGNLPYPIFVFAGLLIWNLFASGLSSASNSMVNNAAIIKKIFFPRLIIPVSAILVSLFDFVMALIIFLGLIAWFQQPVSWNAIYFWPTAVIVACISTLGPGMLLAALNVKYRDFRYVIPFIIQILFFLTPIIYPVTLLDQPILKYILALSPIYSPVELFRAPLSGNLPDVTLMSLSILSSLFWFVAGVYYFKKTEDFFADLA
jgi:lipopolysaccharide transport system permease protein